MADLKTGKWAIITGASSGIGKAFAIALARKGYDLVLIARRENLLKSLGNALEKNCRIQYRVLTADLSDAQAVRECYEQIKDLDIEFFINNAGFGDAGFFMDTDLEKELSMIDVNIRAVHIFTKLMLRYFSKRGGGHLLNVASSAGLLPAGPYMATYYATKAYVCSLTRAAAREVKKRGLDIYVGCLCPGPVDTEFNLVANVRFALPGIRADECVAYALKEMKEKQIVIVPGNAIRLAVFAQRLIPQSWTIALTGRQQEKKM